MGRRRKKKPFANHCQKNTLYSGTQHFRAIDGREFKLLDLPDFESSSEWNLLPKFFLVATVISLLIIAGIIFSLFLPALADQNFAADLVFGLSVGVSSLLILVAIVKFFTTSRDSIGWNQYLDDNNIGWKTNLLIWGSVTLAVLCIAGAILFAGGIASFPIPAVSSIIGNMSGGWIDSAMVMLSIGAFCATYIARSTYLECRDSMTRQAHNKDEEQTGLIATTGRDGFTVVDNMLSSTSAPTPIDANNKASTQTSPAPG